ncbi:hypothetical protein B0H10DRAFT_834893 [Mycena sp. CBHHK59/15]|nr:hypothetical protein B0H10DRAFT_834893 [Mycena sp. CBHHK59/15]
MPRDTTRRPRYSNTLTKTEAKTDYALGDSDLARLPCITKANPHRQRYPMKIYRTADVEALAARIRDAAPIQPASTSGLAAPNGPSILRSRALKVFNLEAVQLDRILPVSAETNPYGARSGAMRYYNVCDVEVLVG